MPIEYCEPIIVSHDSFRAVRFMIMTGSFSAGETSANRLSSGGTAYVRLANVGNRKTTLWSYISDWSECYDDRFEFHCFCFDMLKIRLLEVHYKP